MMIVKTWYNADPAVDRYLVIGFTSTAGMWQDAWKPRRPIEAAHNN